MQALRSQYLAGVQLPSQARHQQRVRRSANNVVKAAKVADGPSVAIVGVTGAVGQEFLRVSRNPHRERLYIFLIPSLPLFSY